MNTISEGCTFPQVKIKIEKLDPEVEAKINGKFITNNKLKDEIECNINESNSNNTGNEEKTSTASIENGVENDDKKCIEPVKSSNEILAELFKVFNATPPEELLDDKSLLKKSHKHKKSKKRKKSHSNLENEGSKSKCDNPIESDMEKKKYKNRQKHKKKKKSYKKSREKDKSSNRKNQAELEPPKRKKIKKEVELSKQPKSNGLIGKWVEVKLKKESLIKLEPLSEKKPITSQLKEEDYISEISLSDEETYLMEREKAEKVQVIENPRSTDRSRSGHHKGIRNGTGSFNRNTRRTRDYPERHRSRKYSRRTWSRSRSRSHSGSHSRSRSWSRSRSRCHSRSRTRSRSRSRSRNRDLGIDKKRLLEIARKNAISMFKKGSLPGCKDMTDDLKDKVLMKMRYGGRTVEDLTEFCKKISKGELLSDISSEESDVSKPNRSTTTFHHPFVINEREPIVINMKSAIPTAPRKTEELTKAVALQFPVSSGQQHRVTERWLPVEKPAVNPFSSTKSSSNVSNNVEKNIFQKPVPQQTEQEPAFKINKPSESTSLDSVTPITSLVSSEVIPLKTTASIGARNYTTSFKSANDAQSANNSIPNIWKNTSLSGPKFVPDVPIPSENAIAPVMRSESFDVSSIISNRLTAIRRLQENPTDFEAVKIMESSQREMSCWVSSKTIPGQFTGTTGANIMKPHELNSGPQAWARKDQFTSSRPVSGGMGMQLLQKMGWKPGEGLGREKTGALQPLLLDVKLDKRGLDAKKPTELKMCAVVPNQTHPSSNANVSSQQTFPKKHPVCLLNELTAKRKWMRPEFKLIREEGPSHHKTFLFSVNINGEVFVPDKSGSTKKDAKMIAAQFSLQKMGILK